MSPDDLAKIKADLSKANPDDWCACNGRTVRIDARPDKVEFKPTFWVATAILNGWMTYASVRN